MALPLLAPGNKSSMVGKHGDSWWEKGDSLPVVEGMYRLPKEETEKLLPQIPTHPISYKDAEPLLR